MRADLFFAVLPFYSPLVAVDVLLGREICDKFHSDDDDHYWPEAKDGVVADDVEICHEEYDSQCQ